MTALDLLAGLALRGFSLEIATDGKLLVTPGSKLTPEDTEAIKAHKADLVRELSYLAKQLRCGCWEFADGCIVLSKDCQQHGWDAGTGPAPTSEAWWVERLVNHNAGLVAEPVPEKPKPARRAREAGLFDV